MTTYAVYPPVDAQAKDHSHLIRRYEQAKDRRSLWESTWEECYDYALPQRGDFTKISQPGRI